MGCYQGIDVSADEPKETGTGSDDGADTGSGGPEPTDDSAPQGAAASPARLWRLSHAQYDNTVTELLGDEANLATGFEPQASATGFLAGADVSYVSTVLAEQYMVAAEELAARAVQDVESLLPCSPADVSDADCIAEFIEQFGRRAFRKPVTDEQRARYLALYEAGKQTEDASAGLEMVVAAILQSPHFLYRFELGKDGESGQPVRLTSHEMAAQLSYLLWDTMPNEHLSGLADEDRLATPEQVATTAEEMLADPRARHVLWSFIGQYFKIGLIGTLTKADEAFTPELAAALQREAKDFVRHVEEDSSGTLAELFTADYSVLDDSSSQLYGVDAPSGEPTVVHFEPGQRSGLLTQAAFLSVMANEDSSNPVARGYFVRTKILCQTVPEPPPDVADDIPLPDETETTRQRYEAHVYDPTCAACHQFIDPIGFGFEHYDAIGAYREQENGVPIDASGELVATLDVDGPFDGALELGERLAESSEVSDCVTRHFFRYAMGRREVEADEDSIETIAERFDASGTELRELVRAMVASDLFLYRIKQ